MPATPMTRFAAAFGLAALLATTALPAHAAPVPTGTVVLKSALASDVIEIRSRRGSNGGRIAAGIATGLILGGIIGSQNYSQNYYGGYYGGPPPGFYGPQVFYPPGYYGPVYPQYAPRYGRPSGWLAYCASRYRSFDPASGTYMGYDGRRHYCR